MADNDILQGFELGFQSSLNLQRVRSEAALRRLHEQQIAQAMALKMQENELQIQYRADAAKAFSAFNMATAPTTLVPGPMGEGTFEVENPQQMDRFQAFNQFITPVIGKYEGMDKAATAVNNFGLNEIRMQNERNEALRLQQQDQFKPSSTTVTLPSGKTVEGVMTSPRQFTPVVEPEIIEEIDPTTGKPRAIMRSGLNRATPLPQDVAARQKVQFERQEEAKKLEFIRKNNASVYADLVAKAPINPETGTLDIPPEAVAQAAKAAGFQSGTLGQMEQQQVGAENVFAVGRRFLPLLNDQTVGIPGFWRRNIVAKVPLVDKIFGTEGVADAVAAESVARQFMAGITKTLRSDSNIAEPERQLLEQAAPDPTRLITKPNTEKVRLYEYLVNAANLSRTTAKRKGVPITPAFLTLDEIASRVPDTERPPDRSKNEISEEEAKQMWEESAMNMIQQLRREVGR